MTAIELYFTLDIDTRQGGLGRFWRSCSLYFSLLRNTDPTVQRLLTPCFLTRCGSTPELWLICPSWAVDCQLKFRFDEDGGFWQLTGGSGTVNGSGIASVDKMATGIITWKMDRCPRLTATILFSGDFENLCLMKPTHKVDKLIWNLFQRDLRHKRSSLTPNSGHSLLQGGIHLQRWWPVPVQKSFFSKICILCALKSNPHDVLW